MGKSLADTKIEDELASSPGRGEADGLGVIVDDESSNTLQPGVVPADVDHRGVANIEVG